jgi:hypothetical protein
MFLDVRKCEKYVIVKGKDERNREKCEKFGKRGCFVRKLRVESRAGEIGSKK